MQREFGGRTKHLIMISKIVQTPRAGLFVPPYFIHFFKERGVCYEKIFKDFYFP